MTNGTFGIDYVARYAGLFESVHSRPTAGAVGY